MNMATVARETGTRISITFEQELSALETSRLIDRLGAHVDDMGDPIIRFERPQPDQPLVWTVYAAPRTEAVSDAICILSELLEWLFPEMAIAEKT